MGRLQQGADRTSAAWRVASPRSGLEAAIGVVVLNQMLVAGRPERPSHARHRIQQTGVGVIACSVLHVHQRQGWDILQTLTSQPGRLIAELQAA